MIYGTIPFPGHFTHPPMQKNAQSALKSLRCNVRKWVFTYRKKIAELLNGYGSGIDFD
jgi:hypothetical protein